MGSGLESLEGARARMPALLGGRPCLDFANTVDPRYGDARREYLTSYADLVAWSRVAAGMGDELAARLALAADRWTNDFGGRAQPPTRPACPAAVRRRA